MKKKLKRFTFVPIVVLLMWGCLLTRSMLPRPVNSPSNEKTASESLGHSRFWMPFENAFYPRSPEVKILESSSQRCILSITTYGMYVEKVKVSDNMFEKLEIPDYGFVGEVGEPRLPAIRGLIEIPPGKKISLTAMEVQSFELSGHMVCPVIDPAVGLCQQAKQIASQIDAAAYSKDTYYLNELAAVSLPAQLRDHTVVQLSVHPVGFNPALKRLRVFPRINVELEYYGGDSKKNDPRVRLSSPAFDEVCKPVIWNYEFPDYEALGEEPMGYLIISNETFCSSMISFVEWKSSLGFVVSLVNLSEISPNATATDIVSYVSNAFHNWTTPPTYLLLVGDVEYLPTCYGSITMSWPKVGVPTDHNFSCVNGEDYLPDLFVGRLSVKTITQLNNVLDKIMGYKGFPYWDPHAILISGQGFEDLCDRYAYDLLVAEDYNVDRLYERYGNATVYEICSAITKGASIVHYNGHGDVTRWEASGFCNKDIIRLRLVQDHKYPIIMSEACLTGKYDDNISDCLGEVWMKSENKGAVAFLGSSDIASGIWSPYLFEGFYKAIFDYCMDEFGPLSVAGKLNLYNKCGDHYGVRLHFDLFNILTDPQLDLNPFRSYEVPTHFPTIQEAIDNAKHGVKIHVKNGTYNENIVISETLSLLGQDKATTTINGQGAKAVVSVTADCVEITGFTLQNHGAYPSCGLHVSSNGNKICSNIIGNNYYGIWLENCTDNMVVRNSFVNNTDEVFLANSSINSWDNGCEGNYWSNYFGVDLNSDGIGDTELPWEGVDYYPLMNPYWNPADVDHDLDVDLYDAVRLLVAYGSEVGDEEYNSHCDIAEPYGKIDLYDAVLLMVNYGKKYCND